MKSRRIFISASLAALCFMLDDASAQIYVESYGAISVDASAARVEAPTGTSTDLIFNDDFDGLKNGGTSCATATPLTGGVTYGADTTTAPNWIGIFGPLPSPSNDVIYAFVAGPDVEGSIIPTASNYQFAMYLLASCHAGSEPPPIGATSTIGSGIDLAAAGLISGNTYYLAVTGAASGGAGANGTVNFTTPLSIGISPRF